MTPPLKALVLLESSGLHRIIGHGTQATTPEFLAANDPLLPPISLVRVTPRFLLYKEVKAPHVGRLNDFHPTQI